MNKLRQGILNRLKNTYCRIGCSKISGVGVFAVRDIPKNVNISYGSKNPRGRRFKLSELKSVNKEVMKMVNDFFVIEKDGTVLLPEYGLNDMDIAHFLNHSNRPNVRTIDGGFNFITSRKVRKGEELTVSYKTYDNIDQSQWLQF